MNDTATDGPAHSLEHRLDHYRKGDIVTVKAIVSTDFEGVGAEENYFRNKVCLMPQNHHSAIWIETRHVTLLVPFFARNDFVVTPDGQRGQVIATFDAMVWVRLENGDLCTWPAADLTRNTTQPAE